MALRWILGKHHWRGLTTIFFHLGALFAFYLLATFIHLKADSNLKCILNLRAALCPSCWSSVLLWGIRFFLVWRTVTASGTCALKFLEEVLLAPRSSAWKCRYLNGLKIQSDLLNDLPELNPPAALLNSSNSLSMYFEISLIILFRIWPFLFPFSNKGSTFVLFQPKDILQNINDLFKKIFKILLCSLLRHFGMNIIRSLLA